MFSWLYPKKKAPPATPRPDKPPPITAAEAQAKAAAKAQAKADQRQRQQQVDQAVWAPRLQAALGDDAALLKLALAAPLLDIKSAAIEALASEDSLRQAEREFRRHDRRVHQIAKRRFEAAVLQRETHAGALALIATAEGLCALPLVPVNHLVALDQGWQALALDCLDPELRQRFDTLRAGLGTAVQAQVQAQQDAQRRAVQQRDAQAALVLAQVAAQAEASVAAAAADGSAEIPTETPADTPAAPGLASEPPAPRPPKAAAKPKPDADQLAQLSALLALADAAQAEGSLATLTQHLNAFDTALQAFPGLPAGDALRQRAAALHAERARLKGWQQWGGGRARDDLVAEAEALARASAPLPVAVDPAPGSAPDMAPGTAPDPTAAAAPDPAPVQSADPAAALIADPGPAPNPDAPPAVPAAPAAAFASSEPARLPPVYPKLDLKAHADAIAGLRGRWRELDRLGAAASQSIWQRFDAALQAAYLPVAARQAAQKAARQDNLHARLGLLTTLDALPDPAQANDDAAALKDTVRALDRFHAAWRQLGPVEHTVPPAARQALLQRQRASLERLEPPLQQARQQAQTQREQLIARAEALAADSALQPDAGAQVRGLQAEWQQRSRGLPLARGLENALWARFKTALDSVFEQRDAARSVRDAEMAAQQAAREARAAQQREHDAAQAQRWQDQCKALATRLALCAEREDAGSAELEPGLSQRWADAPELPAAWAKPLAQRWAAPMAPGAPGEPVKSSALADPALDLLLLQLEASLDLPATPEQQAARRLLKLRALKEAMEGRSSAEPAAPAQALATALRQSAGSLQQRQRLVAVVAALAQAPVGALGITLPPSTRAGPGR